MKVAVIIFTVFVVVFVGFVWIGFLVKVYREGKGQDRSDYKKPAIVFFLAYFISGVIAGLLSGSVAGGLIVGAIFGFIAAFSAYYC